MQEDNLNTKVKQIQLRRHQEDIKFVNKIDKKIVWVG